MISPYSEPPYIAERIVRALGNTIGWAPVRNIDRDVMCANLDRFEAGMEWAIAQGWVVLEYMGTTPMLQHACMTDKGIGIFADLEQVEATTKEEAR